MFAKYWSRLAGVVLLVLVVMLASVAAAGAQGSGPRAFLGVQLEARDEGAFIVEVVGGTAAEDAGLQPGDLITAWDGEPINLSTTLSDYIAAQEPGDEVVLAVERDGDTLEVTVILGVHPEDAAAPPVVVLPAGVVRGLRMNLDRVDMIYAGGLLTVYNVSEYSELAGTLEAGDRITAIDGQDVDDLNYVTITRRMLQGGLTTLEVVRDEQALPVVVDLPQDRFTLMEQTIVDVDALLQAPGD